MKHRWKLDFYQNCKPRKLYFYCKFNGVELIVWSFGIGALGKPCVGIYKEDGTPIQDEDELFEKDFDTAKEARLEAEKWAFKTHNIVLIF